MTSGGSGANLDGACQLLGRNHQGTQGRCALREVDRRLRRSRSVVTHRRGSAYRLVDQGCTRRREACAAHRAPVDPPWCHPSAQQSSCRSNSVPGQNLLRSKDHGIQLNVLHSRVFPARPEPRCRTRQRRRSCPADSSETESVKQTRMAHAPALPRGVLIWSSVIVFPYRPEFQFWPPGAESLYINLASVTRPPWLSRFL